MVAPLATQLLVLGGDAAAVFHEGFAGAHVADLHHRGGTEQAAEIDHVASLGAGDGNHSHGRGLVVDDADSHFIGNDPGKRLRRGISGYSHHVQPHGTYGCHGLELFKGERSVRHCLGKSRVLTNRNESARHAAHRTRSEQPALLHRVVQQSEGGR